MGLPGITILKLFMTGLPKQKLRAPGFSRQEDPGFALLTFPFIKVPKRLPPGGMIQVFGPGHVFFERREGGEAVILWITARKGGKPLSLGPQILGTSSGTIFLSSIPKNPQNPATAITPPRI